MQTKELLSKGVSEHLRTKISERVCVCMYRQGWPKPLRRRASHFPLLSHPVRPQLAFLGLNRKRGQQEEADVRGRRLPFPALEIRGLLLLCLGSYYDISKFRQQFMGF